MKRAQNERCAKLKVRKIKGAQKSKRRKYENAKETYPAVLLVLAVTKKSNWNFEMVIIGIRVNFQLKLK